MARLHHATEQGSQVLRWIRASLHRVGRVHLVICVAMVMLVGAPRAEIRRIQQAEPVESSTPVEERVESPHLTVCRRSDGMREASAELHYVAYDSRDSSPTRSIQNHPPYDWSGHWLTNALRAPLRC